MLEVHIPSVGPEAEAPRQSPEKSHMVSGSNGLEGARGPAGAERNGDLAPRTGRSHSSGPDRRGTACPRPRALGFVSPEDGGPDS